MHVVATRKAATLLFAAAVIVLCIGAASVVPSAISKTNRINNNNIGDDPTLQGGASEIVKQFQQQQQLLQQESSISGGSISDRPLAENNNIPAPAPSMMVQAAPTPSKAPSLGSDFPSIVPAKWGTVAPTANWQQLVSDKGRHHANKVKRQRHLRESYHAELRKRRLTASGNNNNKDNNEKA